MYVDALRRALTLAAGETFLVDAGEATALQIRKCSGIKFGSISRIFITHLHADHLFGLPCTPRLRIWPAKR